MKSHISTSLILSILAALTASITATAQPINSVSRGMSIDKRNPVFIKGMPYALYPIYGVRGVSLYYITSSTNSVKLAVSTARR